jgi:hypothetical protein
MGLRQRTVPLLTFDLTVQMALQDQAGESGRRRPHARLDVRVAPGVLRPESGFADQGFRHREVLGKG